MTLDTKVAQIESPAAAAGASAQPPWFTHLFGTPALFCCVLATFIFLCVPHGMADSDIWWHLRDAEILVHTHHFITHDLFSYTAAGAPWMNHEWIAELPFYAGWKIAGAAGVYAVTLLTIELILFGVFALAFLRSRNLTASLVVSVVATLLSTVSFGPRTLLFGWLCLVAELLILQMWQRRPKLIWLLPGLFLLWVNTHGSWMIGLVVLAAYIVTNALPLRFGFIQSAGIDWTQLRRVVLAALASLAALFVNPYGWRLVAYPFNLAFHQKLNIANVEEWHTLDFQTPRGKIMLATLAIAVLWQLVRPREWTLYELALVAIGIYSGCTYSRFLFLYSILAAPVFAGSFISRSHKARRAPRLLLNVAAMLVLCALVFSRMHGAKAAEQHEALTFPAGTLPVLSALPPDARVFNEYIWGGFLEWHQRNVPVFVDSRVDIFEYNGTFQDYLNIIHLNDTLKLLDQHGVQYVLYERDSPLVYFLQHVGGWRSVYESGNVILLQRATLPAA